MKWWVVAAILLLPTTGCQSDQSEQQYEQAQSELHASFLKSLCSNLEMGLTRADELPVIMASGHTVEEANAYLDEAIATYCPQVAHDGSTGQG